jgi:hypothetical protein
MDGLYFVAAQLGIMDKLRNDEGHASDQFGKLAKLKSNPAELSEYHGQWKRLEDCKKSTSEKVQDGNCRTELFRNPAALQAILADSLGIPLHFNDSSLLKWRIENHQPRSIHDYIGRWA